jgi:hypothetical protein
VETTRRARLSGPGERTRKEISRRSGTDQPEALPPPSLSSYISSVRGESSARPIALQADRIDRITIQVFEALDAARRWMADHPAGE